MPNQHQVVGPRIVTNLKFLKRICRSTSERSRWNLLRKASSEELLALVEVCSNLLRPHCFHITPRQKTRLHPFAEIIRGLARKRTEKGARHYSIQRGSGPFFAAILAPIIAEASRQLITSLTNNG
jgi:hypothetical protein